MGKDKQTFRIVVQIGGEQKLLHISNQTTCGDVIKMVSTDSRYELTETLNGIERILNRKCKMLKVFDKTGFLSIRRPGKQVTKRPCIGHALRKLKEMRTLVKNFKSPQHEKKDSSVLQVNHNVSDNKQHMYRDKSIDELTQTHKTCKLNKGKLDIMKRFLNDCDSHMNNSISSRHDLELCLIREDGDGDSGTPKCPRTRGDGASYDESFFSSFTQYNTCIDLGPLEESSDDVNDKTTEILDFNTAFVEDRDSLLDDSGSDVSIDEHEINIIENTEDSDTNNKYEIMKKLFSKEDLTKWFADDDTIESFMKTVVEQDSESDEGVSSLSSDNGGSDLP